MNCFWKTSNFDVQNAFICGCVIVSQVKRRFASKQGESRRGFSREYYIRKGEESVQVCKTVFKSMFAISDGRINRALKADVAAGGSPHSDQRGHHEPKNKTSLEKKQYVREHIEFPQIS